MSGEWQHASWVSTLGKWAWILGLISGVIDIIAGLYYTITLGLIPFIGAYWMGIGIWWIISGIIAILISFAIIRPKVSVKCAQKDPAAQPGLDWNGRPELFSEYRPYSQNRHYGGGDIDPFKLPLWCGYRRHSNQKEF